MRSRAAISVCAIFCLLGQSVQALAAFGLCNCVPTEKSDAAPTCSRHCCQTEKSHQQGCSPLCSALPDCTCVLARAALQPLVRADKTTVTDDSAFVAILPEPLVPVSELERVPGSLTSVELTATPPPLQTLYCCWLK